MGMYTELKLNVELKQDVPDEVIHILEYMLDDSAHQPPLPDHPLFKTARWSRMLHCGSPYFNTPTYSELLHEDSTYVLNIQCNFKNYDDEIDKFLDWLRPHIQTEGIIGHHWYETDDEPTAIWNMCQDVVSEDLSLEKHTIVEEV